MTAAVHGIEVSGFRSLREVQLPLTGVTLVLGANGAGKSSLAAAFEYALTGSCEWTDRRGAGYANLISHGAKRSDIEVSLETGDPRGSIVHRTLTPKGATIATDDLTGEKATASLSLMLPDQALLRCMLRSDGFLTLAAKEQQDVLFQLAGGEANASWFSERMTSEERAILGPALATRLTGSALADSLYKASYEERKAANAVVKALTGAVETAGTDLPPDVTGIMESMTSDLAKAKGELAQRQQQVGEAQGSIKAHEAAGRRAEAAASALKDAKADLRDLGEQPEPPSPTSAEVQAGIGELQEQLSAQRAVANADDSALQNLAHQLQRLEGAASSCPVMDCECPLGAEAISRHREELKALLEQTLKSRSGANATVSELSGAIATARIEAEAAAAVDADRADWARRKEDLEKRIVEATAANKQALAEYQQTPAPDPTALHANRQAAQERVDRIESDLRDLQRALDADSARKRQREQLAQAQATAKLLDELVKKLSPDGLPAQAMRETVGAVAGAVNAVLADFTDFSLLLGEELAVSRGGAITAVALLSESEKLRVGAAISVAFARLTGFGFVVVDAADRLDTNNRGPLLAMLVNSGVQALVLATPLNGKRPRGDGLTVYDLVDGRIVEAQPQEAQP